MKIIREDERLMVIKDYNILVFCVGIIFFLVGTTVLVKPDFFINNPPLWSGLIGIIIGVFIVSKTKIVTINIDKSSGKLLFLRKWLFGNSYSEYSLSQIKKVELNTEYEESGNNGGYIYHVSFIFNNGETVNLNPDSSSVIKIMGKPIIPEKTLGARIASFLDVPFQERRPTTVNEVLNTVANECRKRNREK